MEQYKEKLKTTQRITAIAALILAVCCILFALSECGVINITPTTGDSHWQHRWRGIICGASFALGILMCAWTIRISKALRNDKELKKLYVEANDERQNQIFTSARALSMQIFLICGLVAGIVAGYFNMTVSVTILACVFIHSLLGGICKLYYRKKF